MDNNDPTNPNSNLSGVTPPPTDQTTPNPWETPAAPAAGLGTSPLPESSWPSSTNTPADPAMNTQMPQAPIQDPAIGPALSPESTPNPGMASNPFLQPQAPQPNPLPTDPSIFSQPAAPTPPADQALPQDPLATPPAQTNPFPSVTPQQDPLNTAFTPVPNPNQSNPFNSMPTQPASPSLNPVGSQTPTTSEMPNPTLPPATDNPQIPSSNQPGTLDLSALQASSKPASEGNSIQPGNQLPETGPVENAPTDLSHLIAGEETNQPPGDIYNPPVASDHNVGLNSTQPQTPSEDGAPPPEKHLNLTKVLLVAGIPIILIVAALSAYVFFIAGKSSPQSTNQTSLPIEQTKPAQAPLTNPPQQIVAPSPNITAPLPSPAGPESSSSGTTLPGSSSSPTSALEQLRARQSAAPSPGT